MQTPFEDFDLALFPLSEEFDFDLFAHPRTYYAVLRSTTVVQFVFGRQNDDDAGGFEQSYDFRRVPRQKLILEKYWSEYF